MNPIGKGIFTWKLPGCAGGNMQLMASQAKAAGFKWVAIKAADGTVHFNQGAGPTWAQPNNMRAAVDALRAVGINVYGWQYLYGANSIRQSIAAIEAQRAIENIERFEFDAWILDPEGEYKRSGASVWADTYMNKFRAAYPAIPIGLCSYRFPTLHPELPWNNFLRHCDFHAPQVYWILAHNSGDQLGRSYRELKALRDLPVIPIGSAYYDTSFHWQPTVAELHEFDRVAQALGLPGIGWWEWEENGHGAAFISAFWEAITSHDWGEPPMPPQDWASAITDWARTMGYVGPGPG